MKETIKQRIVEARNRQGKSQIWLAEQVGCSRPTIQRWEDKNSDNVPDADELESIAQALSVSLEWLLGKKEASSAVDLSELLTDLEENHPDVVMLLRNTESSWHNLNDAAKQNIADGLRFVLGRAKLEDMSGLRVPRKGEI